MGCSFDARVAGAPVITCQSSSDCPPDFFCQGSVGRCVRLLSPGLEPPRLSGQTVVTPTLVRQGASIRVLFGVNEPLARAPRCRAQFSNGSAAELQQLEPAPGTLSYAYELTPPAGAPEGSVRFTADLLDEDGVAADDLELGTAVLDFTPPALVRGAAALTLLPSATNLLSRVEAMNETTLAQITFAVTEPLHTAPVLSAAVGGDAGAVAVGYAGSTGTSHLFTLTLASAQVPQGVVALRVALEDLAGNTADVPVELAAPGLVIDTQAPLIDRLGDGGVALWRAPTGAAFRFGTRGTTITGAPGSTEPLATVIASESPTSPDLARTGAGGDGAFELTLPADLPSVTVRALDAAGNQSRPELVRNASWFASFAGSAPGAANPHRAWSTRALGPGRDPWGAVEHYGSSGLDDLGGGAVATLGAVNWQRRWTSALANAVPTQPTSPRVLAVWDPFRARVIAVEPLISPLSVFEWSGLGWQLIPAVDPEGDGNPPNTSQVLSIGGIAFDEDQRLTLIVTRGTVSGTLATWGWNGSSWRLLAQDATTRCTACALAWDSRQRRVLLFDPATGTTAAWSWATSSWQFLALATAPSLLVAGGAYVFERHTGRWLRFGGAPVHDETWAFDGAAWSRLTDGGPSPRFNALAGYDPVGQRVLLQGGATNSSTPLGDTWSWDGQSWRQVAAAGPGRYGGSLVVAPALGQTLLVGGSETQRLVADGGFELAVFSGQPEARSGMASAYSPFHDALYFAGGVNDAGVKRTSVQTLTERGFLTMPALPEHRAEGGLAIDPTNGRLFYAAGRGPDGGLVSAVVWTSDAGNTWGTSDPGLPLSDGGVLAGPYRTDPIVFYEPSQGALVLAGGRDGTWATNSVFTLQPGSPWLEGGLLLPPSPEACFAGGTVAASGAGVQHLQLGYSSPTASTCSSPTMGANGFFLAVAGSTLQPVPLPRLQLAQGGLAWDDAVSTWVYFGGRANPLASPEAALRVPHGSQWVTVPVADTDGDGSPAGRVRPAMGFFKSTRRVVLYGGETSTRPLDDAWEVDLGGQRPATVVQVSLRDALPRGAVPVALWLDGVAGADDGDGGRPGVALRLWHRQRWLDLGAATTRDGGVHGAPVGLPAPFSVELRTPALLDDLLQEPTLTFAIVPVVGLAPLPPGLVVDYVEARLDSALTGSGP